MGQFFLRLTAVFGLLAPAAHAESTEADGHLKLQLLRTELVSDTRFADLVSDHTTDQSFEFRGNVRTRWNRWTSTLSYQAYALRKPHTGLSIERSANPQFTPLASQDAERLFDLTSTVRQNGNTLMVHRLDRLSLGYQSDQYVFKIGRQAVSWGNGLAFSVMDFFNPFDPSSIDTEYKPGDDMIYLQRLFDNGSDLQAVGVVRRDFAGNTTQDVNSLALKYHGFKASIEFDLLLAQHFADRYLGIGLSRDVGGAVVRGDWVSIDTGNNHYNNIIANISYSWLAFDKNMSGSLEYFHNDFGVRDLGSLRAENRVNSDLTRRLLRREVFSTGRDYLAGSLLVEMAPLWTLTHRALTNLDDSSALLQLSSQHNLGENTQLTVSANVLVGPAGTEYGGIVLSEESTLGNSPFVSSDWSIYGQLAWYF